MLIRDGKALRQAASEIVEILAAHQVRIGDVDKVFEMVKEIISFQPVGEFSEPYVCAAKWDDEAARGAAAPDNSDVDGTEEFRKSFNGISF